MKRRFDICFKLVIGIIIFMVNISCSIPKFGGGMDRNDLIKYSDKIGLAKLVKQENGERSGFINYLVMGSSLKGNCKGDTIKFYTHKSEYDSIHFDNHTSKKFWRKKVKGRSDWPCCICGPDFTFKTGETYLLFPDCFGAITSAEIIRDTAIDKWYLYVKSKL